MIVFANLGLMSKYSPSSTISAITLVHVVRLAVGLGDDLEQLLRHPVDRVLGLAHRRLLLAVRREEREVGLDRLDALGVVLALEVADARLAAVDLGAAEVLHRDLLAGHRLGQVRAGERHRALADDHRHEVREAGDVGGAGGARARASPRPAAPRPTSRPPRGRGGPSRRTASPPPPGSARPAESSSQISGIRFCSASSRRRAILISPVIPIEPAITVKS